MADIAEIKTGSRSIEIVHPKTGANIGLRVSLVSIDDPRLTKLKRSIADRRLHLEARGKPFKAEEIEENQKNIMFAAIDDWEWYNPTGKTGDDGYDADAMPDYKGEQPEFNRKNYNEITTEITWIRDQMSEAIGETRAFFDK